MNQILILAFNWQITDFYFTLLHRKYVKKIRSDTNKLGIYETFWDDIKVLWEAKMSGDTYVSFTFSEHEHVITLPN